MWVAQKGTKKTNAHLAFRDKQLVGIARVLVSCSYSYSSIQMPKTNPTRTAVAWGGCHGHCPPHVHPPPHSKPETRPHNKAQPKDMPRDAAPCRSKSFQKLQKLPLRPSLGAIPCQTMHSRAHQYVVDLDNEHDYSRYRPQQIIQQHACCSTAEKQHS